MTSNDLQFLDVLLRDSFDALHNLHQLNQDSPSKVGWTRDSRVWGFIQASRIICTYIPDELQRIVSANRDAILASATEGYRYGDTSNPSAIDAVYDIMHDCAFWFRQLDTSVSDSTSMKLIRRESENCRELALAFHKRSGEKSRFRTPDYCFYRSLITDIIEAWPWEDGYEPYRQISGKYVRKLRHLSPHIDPGYYLETLQCRGKKVSSTGLTNAQEKVILNLWSGNKVIEEAFKPLLVELENVNIEDLSYAVDRQYARLKLLTAEKNSLTSVQATKEKQEENHRQTLGKSSNENIPDDDACPLIVDPVAWQVRVRGIVTPFDITEKQWRILKLLVSTGRPISSTEFQDHDPELMRSDSNGKAINRLPKPIRNWIDSKTGTGYWVRKSLP